MLRSPFSSRSQPLGVEEANCDRSWLPGTNTPSLSTRCDSFLDVSFFSREGFSFWGSTESFVFVSRSVSAFAISSRDLRRKKTLFPAEMLEDPQELWDNSILRAFVEAPGFLNFFGCCCERARGAPVKPALS